MGSHQGNPRSPLGSSAVAANAMSVDAAAIGVAKR
jgi:hypothetical protein